jgi:GT2 family glycosyltransferase
MTARDSGVLPDVHREGPTERSHVLATDEERRAEPKTDGERDQILAELAHVIARQRENLRAHSAAAATLAAIKASNTYRLTRLFRPAAHPAAPAGPSPLDPGASAPPSGGHHLEILLDRERRELAYIVAESRRVHHDLNIARQSRPRLALVALNIGARQAMKLANVAAVWRRLSHRGAIGGLRRAWRHLRWNTTLLRVHPAESYETDQSPSAAVRWLSPVRISGETCDALLARPNSVVRFRVPGQAGARLVASCALHPESWQNSRGGVEFALAVEIPGQSWSAQSDVRMDPGERSADRRWRRLSIALPPEAAKELVIRLTTRLPAGVGGSDAWSLWGEPRLESRTTPGEMWRSVRRLGSRFRYTGLLSAPRMLRDLQGPNQYDALYQRWIDLHTPAREALDRMRVESETLPFRPRISMLLPVHCANPRSLAACIESIRRQVYQDWELYLADDGSTAADRLRTLQRLAADPRVHRLNVPLGSGISGAANAALNQASGEFLTLLDHDGELAPEALFEVVRLLNRHPDADFVYSDEDKVDRAGQRHDPSFKPDWSPEHFHSCMYTGQLTVLRTRLVREVGGIRDHGSHEYDLALRVVERTSRIHHLPYVLYHRRHPTGSIAASDATQHEAIAGERALTDHLARTKVDAVVVPGPGPGLYRIRHRVHRKPLVSIVIPTDGRTREAGGRIVDLLANCLKSIVGTSTYENYELVIADNGRLSEVAEALLESIPHRRVHFAWSGLFNYARKLNFAARHARGEHLLLFNDDIEVITSGWIEAMLEYSQQPEIGGVGAKLLYPDGRLQHIGVVLGVGGIAAHAFHSHPGSSAGYGSSALIVRNYSAVTAACMMTRKELYDRLHGFDERFAFDFNDMDYCLRLRRDGYRIVFTPHAELYHLESATFGARTWNAHDLAAMRETWGDVCERDPYYNPHLTRDFPDYRVRV